MNLKLLHLLLLSFFLYSCSGKQTDTVFVMDLGHLVTGADHDGGVMVWGQNQTLGDRMGLNITSTNDTISLKNGLWKFWAVSWDGGAPMVGNTKCAVITVDIAGGAQEVNMSLATANCTAAEFADSNYTGGTTFDDTQFEICQFGDDLATTCNLSSFGSFKVSLPSYNGPSIVNQGLNQCFSGNSGSGLRIPAGKLGVNLPFKLDIHLYVAGNTTCTGPSFAIMPFNTGMANGVPILGHSYSSGNMGAAINTVRVKKSLAVTAPVFNNINSAGTVVTSNDNIPEINFTNVIAGDIVKLYDSMANCTNGVSEIGSANAGATSVAVYTAAALAEGIYSFYAKKIDSATNVSNCISAGTYTVDLTPPSVTINQDGGQADPALSLPIVFDLNFSEPINPASLTSADFTVTGTATYSTLNWNIATANNQNYTITLLASSVFSTDGTIIVTVPASSVTDIAGNTNAASSSSDNTVVLNLLNPASATSIAWASTIVNSQTGLVINWTPSAEASTQDVILYTNAACTTTAGYQQLALGSAVSSTPFTLTQAANTEQNYYAKIVTHDGYGRSSSACTATAMQVDLESPVNATSLSWSMASPQNTPSGIGATWTPSVASDKVEQRIQYYSSACLPGNEYGSEVILGASDTNYMVMLVDNQQNYYVIRTYDDAGNISQSPCSPVMVIDSQAPSIIAINVPMPLYKTGEMLNIQLIFDEAAYVVGMPELEFILGDRSRKAIYTSGDSTTTWTFQYMIEIGDYDSDDEISTAGTPLMSGNYQDFSGNMGSNVSIFNHYGIKINGIDNGADQIGNAGFEFGVVKDMAEDPSNGDLYVVGNFTEYDSNPVPGIVKFTKNPVFPYDYIYDPSFDANVAGKIGTNIDDSTIDINTVAVDMTGKVYLGGNFSYEIQSAPLYYAYDLIRLNSDGTLETGFYNLSPGANRGTSSAFGNKIFDIEIMNGASGEKIYVAGSFATINLKSGSHSNQCLLLIDNTGSATTAFTSNIATASVNCSGGGITDVAAVTQPTTANAYEVMVGGKFSFNSSGTKYSLMKYNLSNGIAGPLVSFNNSIVMSLSDRVISIEQIQGGPNNGKILYAKEMSGPSYTLGMVDYSNASQITSFMTNFQNSLGGTGPFFLPELGTPVGIMGLKQIGGQIVILGDFRLDPGNLARSMVTVNLEGSYTGGDFGFLESSGTSIDSENTVTKILTLQHPNSPKAIFAGNINEFHALGASGSINRIFGLP